MATGAVIARILTQYSDKGSKAAQKDIARLEKKINAFGKKAVKSFALAGAATAAFAVKLGVDAVKGAAADEKQQAALATALRNTTNATDEAIAANQKYLDALELQVAIDNEKLIPALQQLVTATGDLRQGQALLSLATDVSAASNKDLSVVSAALSKAVNGNFGALTKLGLPLDLNAVKSKNLTKLLLELARVSEGQAAAAADTFAGRVESLRLRFLQISDKIGTALMPALIVFADYIENKVVPLLDLWITKNEYQLNAALEKSVGKIEELVKAFQDIYGVLEGVNAILPFGIGGWLKLAVAISAFSTAAGLAAAVALRLRNLKIMYTATRGSEVAFKALRKEMGGVRGLFGLIGAGFAKIANWATKSTSGIAALVRMFMKLGKVFMSMNPWVRAILVLGTALGWVGKQLGWWDKIFGNKAKINPEAERSFAAAAKSTESMDDALNKYRKTQEAKNKKTKEEIALEKALADIKAKTTAEDKKKAKLDADIAKLNARIAKDYGVKLLSSDEEKLVQLNAAEALLKRQKEINTADIDRLKRMKDEILSMQVRNDLAKRYQDILQALADQKIDTKEIAILAKMWGVPTEAVEAYLATIFAVEDAKISDDEIVNLAMKWGSTQAQAAQYLDFFQALNDGVLSDAEIQKLKSKWNLTTQEVMMYADFVGIVNDGKLDDDEIIKIREKWKLTNDQVVNYIQKMGAPVSYSGTLIDPAKAAEIGWLNATAALQRYLDLLKKGTGVVVPPTTPTTPTVPTVPTVPAVPPSHDGKIISDAAAAAAKAAEQIATLTEMRTQVAPGSALSFKLKEQIDELKETGGSLFTAITTVDEQTKMAAMRLQSAASIPASFDVGSFRQAEEASMAGIAPTVSNIDYDEKFRFNRGTVATAQGISGSNLMAAPVVNITVQGSVTAEQDLVQTVRNGLLATQYNGNQLLLEAI